MTFSRLEDKLSALEECGFKLNDHFHVANLVETWGREALDEPGFDLTLICLGMTQEAPPWAPHCDNLWHFDTECIDGDGSYMRIAKRLTQMAQGSLSLSGFRDRVDTEEGAAWLQFQCESTPINLELAIDDDWVDTRIFSTFVDLLAKYDPNKLVIVYRPTPV